ncbi:MAG TPA: class I SAM-dependent methyltransferase, partial [Thermomicrobiales bacterium]|nr:class I SAM-dependent methyltransferase [Thermomicrobiales bacterium]
MRDPKLIVGAGYDAIAARYLNTRRAGAADLELLDDLAARLPDGASVLDLGCGAGVPVAQRLAGRLLVTGVDISAAQIALARQLVPDATFLQADMTALDFPDGAFDAVVSFYAIIHVPREEHPALFR